MALINQPYIPFDFVNWDSPNRYSYKEPAECSGVYIIAKPGIIEGKLLYQILYVGCSKNVKNRYLGHKLWHDLKKSEGYIKFFFKECSDYKSREKELIKDLQPKHNINGK